jgi:hypothetical protein
VEEKQKQTILDIPKVIAVGISAPVATILTSRFGVAGTLIGLALSAVILTALADMLKVYLARSSHSGKGTRRGGEDAWWSASSPFLAQRPWQAKGSVRQILISFTCTYPATLRHDRQRRSSGDLIPCGPNHRYGSRAGCGQKPFLLGVARLSHGVFYRRWW